MATTPQLSMFAVLDTAQPSYPRSPGFKGLPTSAAAAEHISDKASGLRGLVLTILRNHPSGLTPDEVAEKAQVDRLSIRPRCSELLNAGKIVATAMRRKNASGLSAAVLRLSPSTIVAVLDQENPAARPTGQACAFSPSSTTQGIPHANFTTGGP